METSKLNADFFITLKSETDNEDLNVSMSPALAKLINSMNE